MYNLNLVRLGFEKRALRISSIDQAFHRALCQAQFPRSIKKPLLKAAQNNEPESFLLHLRSTFTGFVEPPETLEPKTISLTFAVDLLTASSLLNWLIEEKKKTKQSCVDTKTLNIRVNRQTMIAYILSTFWTNFSFSHQLKKFKPWKFSHPLSRKFPETHSSFTLRWNLLQWLRWNSKAFNESNQISWKIHATERAKTRLWA